MSVNKTRLNLRSQNRIRKIWDLRFLTRLISNKYSSVLNVKGLVGTLNQESRGLLRDYEPSDGPSFEALLGRSWEPNQEK